MNEQLIDQVIAPVTTEQVTTLTKLLDELDIQMGDNIKTANALNNTLLNTTSFTALNKSATQTALQLEKIQQAQNKTVQTTLTLNETQAKVAAAQQARDDKAAAQLAKKQAAQAAADAKEIAAAEAKAAKLQAIQDEQARKAAVQFPETQTAPNPVTTDDSPAVRYEPIITGNEDMSATVSKSTEAIAAENAALLEQQEVLGSLTVAQRANIEALLALQAERAENTAELKALTVEDAASAERAVFLTAEQVRLKIAINQVSVELNRQTKEALAADGAMAKLDQSVLLLRTAYEQLSVAERESEQGQAMLAELNALDAENKKLALDTGNTSKEIGAYEKAIAKATSGTQLAAQAVTIATRSIIRMIVQFALFGVVLKAAEWLYQYIAALNIFNPVATEAEQKQKALTEAFENADYTKGLESMEQLKTDLDLASKGFGDADAVVDEYNKTIGKTFGYVDDLTQAQKGFIDNSKDYIKVLYLEAAAQINMADAAKFAADTEVKNQKLRDDIQKAKEDKLTLANYDKANPNSGVGSAANMAAQNRRVQDDLDDIADNNKRMNDYFNNSLKANEDFYTQLDAIKKAHGVKGGGKADGASDIATLKNQIANEQLEHEKDIAQEQINNEKLSYAARIKAVQDFYSASKQIADNNEKLATNGVKLSADQKAKIEGDYNNQVLQMQIARDNQIKTLQDKEYKQEQEILKNNLDQQREIFKQVSEDPNQSYDMKLIALKMYEDKSLQLIKATYKEEVAEAGKNGLAVKIAKQNEQKSELDLEVETASAKLKIQKENLSQILQQAKEGEQDQLNILDNGSKLALRVLTEAKDAKKNAIELQYKQGKISEKQYQQDLLDIDDQYAIDRINQEIATQAAILGVKEGQRDSTALQMKINGASPTDIAKFVSEANKGIQPTVDKLADLQGIDLPNAIAKKGQDDTTDPTKEAADRKAKIEAESAKALTDSIDSIDKLRQKAFEAEISRLEKQGELIDQNAQNEKNAVNSSIVSAATKAREISVIDAQTAAQKQALQGKINQEKHKADVAEKEATIAKIIVQGALAVVQALTAGPGIGEILAGITAASVAVELATAIATPLPTYAKGTKNYPGGLGIWGEAGMERAKLPDGSVQFSNGAAIANFPKGTVITPHMELMQQIRPEPVKFAGGEKIGWEEVLKQLKKMEPKPIRNNIYVNNDNGFKLYQQQFLNR